MPSLICDCGGNTNSACSNHFVKEDGEKTKCYAKIEDGKWSKGCDYDNSGFFDRHFADKLIKENMA